jgi:hypothetical protein
MIAYEKPGARAPMQVKRFRTVGSAALMGFPLGWLTMCFSVPSSWPYALGIIVVAVAFLLTLSLIATGTNVVASGSGNELDEFELSARSRAQSQAYRWFGMFITGCCVIGALAGLLGFTITNADERFMALLFWIIGYGALLPGWFLARILPSQAKEY